MAAPLVVAQVGKLYWPHVGGVEAHMKALACALPQLGAGVGVEVIVGQARLAGPRRDVVDGIGVQRVATLARLASNPVTAGLGRALAASRASLFHFHSPFPSGELAALRVLRGRPFVVTHHMDIWRQRLLLRGFAPFQRAFFARARLLIATSAQMADGSALLRAHRDRVVVVPLAIDPQAWDADPGLHEQAALYRQQLGGGRLVLLFVGRLVYYKQLDLLLRAVDGLAITLVIAGTGPLEAALRRQAAGITTARVVFTGPVDDARLRLLYRAADAFVLPSGHPAEAFGQVLLEAGLHGLPLLTTDVPTGVQHVNLHEHTGLVVPAGNPSAMRASITRLAADAGLRRGLGEGARERVLERFGIQRIAGQLADIYRHACR